MKGVLISIQPYYVFLIIARSMGWNIPQEKTVEVRKDFPKARDWNKVVHIYCSKNRKSFNRIPKQYRPFMDKLLGKVIGEFVCDKIGQIKFDDDGDVLYEPCLVGGNPCLTLGQLQSYIGVNNIGYGWHISNLKIYDKPKELKEFYHPCNRKSNCFTCKRAELKSGYCGHIHIRIFDGCANELNYPPQSWFYVEGLAA